MSLSELCKELNNWFVRDENDIHLGTFSIIGGVIRAHDRHNTIALDGLIDGQYFRVVGSLMNDGVYNAPTTFPQDETFDGAVWSMAVPQAVIDLSKEIDDWVAKYGVPDSAAMSPFTSESFGGYSYTKGSSSRQTKGGDGNSGAWQNVFASRLSKWRKIRTI